MKSDWKDGDRIRSVELEREGGTRWRVRVDGAELALEATPLPGGRLRLAGEHGVTVAEVTAVGTRRFVRLGALDFVLEREPAGRRRAGSPEAHGLESPMPGLVTRVMVAAGDAVAKGQPLVAIEAMKMEHLIRSPREGKVKRIAARAGEMVNGGVALVELEAAS